MGLVARQTIQYALYRGSTVDNRISVTSFQYSFDGIYYIVAGLIFFRLSFYDNDRCSFLCYIYIYRQDIVVSIGTLLSG